MSYKGMARHLFRILPILLLLPVLFSASYGLSVSNSTWNITSKPNQWHSSKFKVTLNNTKIKSGPNGTLWENESVQLSSNKGWIVVSGSTQLNSNNSFTISLFGQSSPGLYEGEVSIEGKKKKVWTNETEPVSATSISTFINITYNVTYPYVEEFSGWINDSYYFKVNGVRYNVTRIATGAVWLNNETINLVKNESGLIPCKTEVKQVSPGGWAELTIKSKQNEDVSFESGFEVEKKKEEGEKCMLGLKTEGTMTFTRGTYFSPSTINVKDPKQSPITNVHVQIYDLGRKDKPLIYEGTSSGSYGSFMAWIPKNAVGKFKAKLHPTSESESLYEGGDRSNCTPATIQVKPGTPYNQYIKNETEFQLKLEIDKKEYIVGDKLTGTFENKKGGKVETGYVKVTEPDGDKVETKVENSTFSYKLEKEGKYTLVGTKENYIKSDKVKVDSLNDTDNDGISNKNEGTQFGESCVDKKGIKELDGCPKIKPEFRFYGDKGTVEELTKDNSYTARLYSNGEFLENYTGKVVVAGAEREIKNGTFSFSIGSEGKWTVKTEDPPVKYKKAKTTVTVKKGGIKVAGNLPYVAIIVIGLIGCYVAYRLISSGGKKKKKTTTNDQNITP